MRPTRGWRRRWTTRCASGELRRAPTHRSINGAGRVVALFGVALFGVALRPPGKPAVRTTANIAQDASDVLLRLRIRRAGLPRSHSSTAAVVGHQRLHHVAPVGLQVACHEIGSIVKACDGVPYIHPRMPPRNDLRDAGGTGRVGRRGVEAALLIDLSNEQVRIKTTPLRRLPCVAYELVAVHALHVLAEHARHAAAVAHLRGERARGLGEAAAEDFSDSGHRGPPQQSRHSGRRRHPASK